MSNHSASPVPTAIVDMNRQLQKTFRLAEKQVQLVLAALRDTTGVLARLSNLAEQLHCCHKVNLEGTPLAQFDAIKEGLCVKLQLLLEDNLSTLAVACDTMEKASAQLHRQKEATMTYFQQHGCSVSESLKAEPLWPCVASMLEWLEDLDNHVHYLYCEKKHLMDSIDLGDMQTVEDLAKSWKSDIGVETRLTDLMLHLQYFMNEKF